MRKSKHTIDFLFPIALFFVFACSSLIVLLYAANTYENIVSQSNNNFESGTCLAYITEKIRQNDSDCDIFISSIDELDALTIQETIDTKTYTTYIYELDGTLYELYMQEGVSITPKAGTKIMNVNELEMKEISPSLFEFTCKLSDQTTDSLIIGLSSN